MCMGRTLKDVSTLFRSFFLSLFFLASQHVNPNIERTKTNPYQNPKQMKFHQTEHPSMDTQENPTNCKKSASRHRATVGQTTPHFLMTTGIFSSTKNVDLQFSSSIVNLTINPKDQMLTWTDILCQRCSNN